MSCAESLRVQAYFDGELRSGEAGDVEEHLTQCVPCQGLLEDLERTRSTLRRSFSGEQASPGLRPRVMRALDAEEASPTQIGRAHV